MKGYVYLVESDGLVKVGSSGSGRLNRVAAHVGTGQLLCWSSVAHEGYRGTERELIARLSQLAPAAKGMEWFPIDFMTALRVARDYCQGLQVAA